jgi:hypothetical protein
MNKLLLITFIYLGLSLNTFADPSFDKDVQPFMEEYCIRCHGAEKQKGDRRYDNIKIDFNVPKTAILWQDILDQLLLEEMPPKKPFPAVENHKKVVSWISNKFKQLRDENSASENGTVMRRLSHMEYTNSLKALFNLDLPNFDLTRGLTDDNIIEGFDTEAKQLKTTPYLFSKYLEIADRFIEKAIPSEKPQWKNQKFVAKQFRSVRDSFVVKFKAGPALMMFGGTPDAARTYNRKFTSPADGFYKFTINAEAVNRDKNWKAYRTPKPGTPWKLKVLASNPQYGPLEKPNTGDYDITTITISDDKKNYEFEGFLRKGFTLILYWENGGGGQPGAIRAETKHFKSGVDYQKVQNKLGKSGAFLKLYKGAYLKVNNISAKGPYFKDWPPKPVASIFGSKPPEKLDMEFVQKKLSVFASRAWRRPVKPQELTPIFKLVKQTLEQESYLAVSKGIKAILCSPNFLYHNQNKGQLNDFALADRLSYFLWGRSPDLELLRLAYRKQLQKPEVYNTQVTRLIQSPHIKDFIGNFSRQWLLLDRAKEMPPDEATFKKYYNADIDRHMISETQEFLHYLIKKNLSIYNCLDSDFALLNEPMAAFYGLKNQSIQGDEFRKVDLPQKTWRGGLISQASVLTATSNGVDTSPVIRGVWVLEKLLGTHPAPPPADVEPLEPDIRGSKTIKERLVAHREKESCNDCHRKFDYLGLALENFNPVGQYRTHYGSKKKVKVDAKSVTPDGTTLHNITHLKSFLLKRKKHFSRGLTEKLLAYGTGRKMSYIERSEIDDIVTQIDKKNGFADLLRLVATSEIFKNK